MSKQVSADEFAKLSHEERQLVAQQQLKQYTICGKEVKPEDQVRRNKLLKSLRLLY